MRASYARKQYSRKRVSYDGCGTQYNHKRVLYLNTIYPFMTVLDYESSLSTSAVHRKRLPKAICAIEDIAKKTDIQNKPQVIAAQVMSEEATPRLAIVNVLEASRPTAQSMWMEPEVHTWER